MWVNQMEDVLTLTLTLTVLPHCHSLITYLLPYSGGVMWVNQMEDVLTLTLTLTVLPHCHSLITYLLPYSGGVMWVNQMEDGRLYSCSLDKTIKVATTTTTHASLFLS